MLRCVRIVECMLKLPIVQYKRSRKLVSTIIVRAAPHFLAIRMLGGLLSVSSLLPGLCAVTVNWRNLRLEFSMLLMALLLRYMVYTINWHWFVDSVLRNKVGSDDDSVYSYVSTCMYPVLFIVPPVSSDKEHLDFTRVGSVRHLLAQLLNPQENLRNPSRTPE